MPKDAGSHEALFTVHQVQNALKIQRTRSKKRRKRQQKRRLAGKRSAKRQKISADEAKAKAAAAESNSDSSKSSNSSQVPEFSLRTDIENISQSNGFSASAKSNVAEIVSKSDGSQVLGTAGTKRPRTDDDVLSDDGFESDSDVLDDSDDE